MNIKYENTIRYEILDPMRLCHISGYNARTHMYSYEARNVGNIEVIYTRLVFEYEISIVTSHW